MAHLATTFGKVQRNVNATEVLQPTPMYRFENLPDTPTIQEPVIPASDEPNIYGSVCFREGEVRVRVDGFVSPLWSVWIGKRLTVTTYDSSTLPIHNNTARLDE